MTISSRKIQIGGADRILFLTGGEQDDQGQPDTAFFFQAAGGRDGIQSWCLYSSTLPLSIHIARLMKSKGLAIPEFITFSGNGSKIIRLAGGGNDLSTLMLYTKVIFGEIYGVEKVPAMEFRLTSNPKEITCKGGLECTDPDRFEALEEEIKTTLTGVDATQTTPPATLHYTDLQKEEVVTAVVDEVNAFIDFFFTLNGKFNYYHYFGIDGERLCGI